MHMSEVVCTWSKRPVGTADSGDGQTGGDEAGIEVPLRYAAEIISHMVWACQGCGKSHRIFRLRIISLISLPHHHTSPLFSVLITSSFLDKWYLFLDL